MTSFTLATVQIIIEAYMNLLNFINCNNLFVDGSTNQDDNQVY